MKQKNDSPKTHTELKDYNTKFLEVGPEFSLFHCSPRFPALICLSELESNNLGFSKVPHQNKTKLYIEGQTFTHGIKS